MNQFKFDAFLSEFPALRQAIGKREARWCESISVSRMDSDLLSRTPKEYEAVGSLVGIHEGDKVCLVVGNTLHAVTPEYDSRSNYAHEDPKHEPGETLLEVIARTGEPELVIWIEYGLGAEDHFSTPEWRATVYKPAKGEPVADMIEEAKRKAEAEVKAEAEF